MRRMFPDSTGDMVRVASLEKSHSPCLNFNAGFIFGWVAEGKGFELLGEVVLPDSLFWPRSYRERERELVGAVETAQRHIWEAGLKH